MSCKTQLASPIGVLIKLLGRQNPWLIFPNIDVFLKCEVTLQLCSKFLLKWRSKIEYNLLSKLLLLHPLSQSSVGLIDEHRVVEVIRE